MRAISRPDAAWRMETASGTTTCGCEPLRHAKRHQCARGIRGELDAGAGFGQLLGLFVEDDAEALVGERLGGGEAADPGAGDEDGSRCRHGALVA